MYIYIYIYIYTHMYVCVYIYIYIYTSRVALHGSMCVCRPSAAVKRALVRKRPLLSGTVG